MTKITKPNEVKREWIVLDAEGKRFGRLLTEVATILRGKTSLALLQMLIVVIM